MRERLLSSPTNNELRVVGSVLTAAASRDFTLDRVKILGYFVRVNW